MHRFDSGRRLPFYLAAFSWQIAACHDFEMRKLATHFGQASYLRGQSGSGKMVLKLAKLEIFD